MKKVRYYKAIKEKGEVRFVESWGEPLTIELPCGAVLNLACEFKRGDGWKVTDTATGYLAQNKPIRNKEGLAEYYKDVSLLKAFSRTIKQNYYQKAKSDLQEYQKQFI